MARLQEKFLNRETPPHFFYREAPEAWQEIYHAKVPDAQAARQIHQRLQENWESIRQRILPHHVPAAELESILTTAGAPTTPDDLGWPVGLYEDTVAMAACTRDRFTFLDLLYAESA